MTWQEQDLYGSARLGIAKPEREMTGFFGQSASYTLVTGARSYELSNHLGNVLAVISDRGELQSAQDFFPFGMAMPGRSTNAKHRYGFNGKETDPETGIQDYGMRWYLPNIARFPSVDPIAARYPMLTPYQFASNRPIDGSDLDGLEYKKEVIPQADGTTLVKIDFFTHVYNASKTLKTKEEISLVANTMLQQFLKTTNGVKPDGTAADNYFDEATKTTYQFTVSFDIVDKLPFDMDNIDTRDIQGGYYTMLTDKPANSTTMGGTIRTSHSVDNCAFRIAVGEEQGTITTALSESSYTRFSVHEWLHPVLEHPWAGGSELYELWSSAVKEKTENSKTIDWKQFDAKYKAISDNIMNSEEVPPGGSLDFILQSAIGTTLETSQRQSIEKAIPSPKPEKKTDEQKK